MKLHRYRHDVSRRYYATVGFKFSKKDMIKFKLQELLLSDYNIIEDDKIDGCIVVVCSLKDVKVLHPNNIKEHENVFADTIWRDIDSLKKFLMFGENTNV
jgi:hypothetical protein